MNFHIGQDVVSMNNKRESGRKKGDLCIIKAIRECPCGCGTVECFTGFYYPADYTIEECETTGRQWENPLCQDWDFKYAPLQTASEEADMNEAIQESIERIFQ